MIGMWQMTSFRLLCLQPTLGIFWDPVWISTTHVMYVISLCGPPAHEERDVFTLGLQGYNRG